MDRRDPDYQATGTAERQNEASVSPGAQVSSSSVSAVSDVGVAALDPRSETFEDPRCASLLRQGDELYARGDYQAAVHVWTRILFLDRGNADARSRIENAKRVMAERLRRLDLEIVEASRLLDAGEVERARSAARAVLQSEPSHGEAAQLLAKIEALERRCEPVVAPEPSANPDPIGAVPPVSSRGVVFRVRRDDPSRSDASGSTASRLRSLKMVAFLLSAVGVFAVCALYLHENWDALVGDGAFSHPDSPGSALAPARPIASVPSDSELRYYNGARLFADGRYRDALAELSRVEANSPWTADARSLILRIEERLLRGASGPEGLEAVETPEMLETLATLETKTR